MATEAKFTETPRQRLERKRDEVEKAQAVHAARIPKDAAWKTHGSYLRGRHDGILDGLVALNEAEVP